ncbi:MAG: acyltransferase family protein [Solobacterium sp.]|nr:acyltransferase family protein [Solobacterium sp.]
MTIDALKFIFSLCIIGVHINLFQDLSAIAYRTFTQSLFRIGVPFYFIVSGYFFAGKLENRERSNQWLNRLLKIYLVFEVLDIILTALVPRIAYPLPYIILRFFTTGLNRIYWYLISLILTCFLCRNLWKKGYTLHLISAGLFLYLITMTYDSYSFLFENTFLARIGEAHTAVWAWPQAGFCESVLFLSAGVYLRQKKTLVTHLNILLCVSLILLVMEGNFCQAHGAADANCYFSLIPASVFLFLYALRKPDLLKIPKAGEMSLYIYMTHIYFSFVSLAVSQNTVIRFLFIAAVSCAVSFLIVRIQNRKVQKKG